MTGEHAGKLVLDRTCNVCHAKRRDDAAEGLSPRFWAKVDRSGGPDACWPWLEGRSHNGYGKFAYSVNGTKVNARANRMALTLSGVDLKPEEFACHQCDNPSCCNPMHLAPGMPADNTNEREQRTRHAHDTAWNPRGSQNPRSKLTEAIVIEARRRFAAGGVSKSQLAREFGVSSTMMSWAITGKSWAHVPLESTE